MLRSIPSRYLQSALAVRVSFFSAILICFLAIASPLPAQVYSSPGNTILSPGGTKTFTITVQSGTTLGSASVLTLGAPNLDFTEVASGTSCPNVVSGSCTVEVQFQPTAPGRRQGAVVLADASGNVLLSVSLDGTADGSLLAFAPSAISTFAGGGNGGDGGPATSAQLAAPMGIAQDGFGNFYVVDQKANKVRKVTPTGVISTFAGTGTAGFSGDGGPATSAELNGPMDVVVDGGGDVYISDTDNNVVRMVNTAGIISTYAGQYYAAGATPPAVCSAATNSVGDGCPGNQIILRTPVGLVFCHAQNLHIADKLDNRVRTVDRIGYNTFTQVGDGAAGYNGDGELNTSAELNGPTGLDMDAANYIYVADTGNHIVRKTLLTGTTPNPISTIAGMPGAVGNSGDGGAATSAGLNSPTGVRVDPAGDLYVSDPAANVVRKVNPADGVISTVAGTATAGFSGDGGDAASARLNGPAGVWLDQSGSLYIADSQNSVVRRVDLSDGPSLTFGPTAVGATSAAQDVTVMNAGNVPLNISQVTTAPQYSLGGADTSCNSSGTWTTLNPAANCVLGIEFMPTAAGNVSGTVVLTDSGSPPSQTIDLAGSTGSTAVGYTVTAKTPAISLAAGANGTAALILNSQNYAGTVSFAMAVTSTDGTAADLTVTASPVTLAPGGTGTSTLTVAANQYAGNQPPGSPWSGRGAPLFCAALLGLPFVFRRKRLASLFLLIAALAVGVSQMACSGSTNTLRSPWKQGSRTYVVTATPAATAMGSVTVTNPAPTSIVVTVQ